MKKKIKLVISVCAAVLCIVIGIVIYNNYNNLPSVVMNKRIDAFNELCAFYETYGPQNQFYENGYSDYVYGQRTKLADKCGLGSGYFKYADYIMGYDFVDTYLEQYSVEEFIEKLYYIYKNTDEHEYADFCNARTTNKVLLYALVRAGIDTQPFVLPAEGTEGYYTENPNSLPEERTWEESGLFYSSSGENKNTQNRSCSIKVTIHGDFAVEHCDIYHYSKGAYEWRNGEFIDELPSWRHEVYDVIHYKGHWIRDDLSTAALFTVGDTCYVLYAPDDCGYGDHTSRKWDILG